MTDFTEQRKHVRLPINTSVFISGEAFDRLKTETLDFSDGGIFVKGEILCSLKIDTIVQVQTTDDIEDPPLLTARVAWTNRFGAGLEYILDD